MKEIQIDIIQTKGFERFLNSLPGINWTEMRTPKLYKNTKVLNYNNRLCIGHNLKNKYRLLYK